MKNEELPALCRTVLHSFFMLWYVRLTCGCQKQKYLKLSSFWKEEYPKGEVVGKINIDTQSVVKPTTPPVGHPSFQKEGSQIP